MTSYSTEKAAPSLLINSNVKADPAGILVVDARTEVQTRLLVALLKTGELDEATTLAPLRMRAVMAGLVGKLPETMRRKFVMVMVPPAGMLKVSHRTGVWTKVVRLVPTGAGLIETATNAQSSAVKVHELVTVVAAPARVLPPPRIPSALAVPANKFQ